MYGLNYGMGASTLAKKMKCSIDKAKGYLEGLKNRYPELVSSNEEASNIGFLHASHYPHRILLQRGVVLKSTSCSMKRQRISCQALTAGTGLMWIDLIKSAAQMDQRCGGGLQAEPRLQCPHLGRQSKVSAPCE